MSIRKFITKGGDTKYEVELCTSGRGSKRLRRRFDTKMAALTFYEEYRLRKREQKKVGYGVRDFEETTFRAEAEYWLKHRSREFSPGHLKRSMGILKEILPALGNLSPIRVQPELLSDYQNSQLKAGLCPATVNRKTEVITAILSFAVKHRRIPYNPSNGFQKLKPVRQGVSFWERHEAEAFLTFADKKYPVGSPKRWIYVVYLMALNTAMRAGEIWGLQPQDLVANGELLFIQRQFDRVKGDFGPLKWRMPPRHVPCNTELHRELTELIVVGKVVNGQTVLRDSSGKPICHEVFVRNCFHRDMREAGIRKIRFHDLRHTATTLMIAEGTDVNTVRDICGHKSLKTTMDYVHMLGGAVKKVAKFFGVSSKKPSPPTALPTEECFLESPRLSIVR